MRCWIAIACLAACSSPSEHAEPASLTVYAAASLTEALQDAAHAFEADGRAQVRFNFAGSQILRHQIEQGAPADVFVAASMEHVRGDIASDLESPALLACNELVLAVAPSSAIQSFRDLPSASRIVLGTPEVPVGAYSEQILHGAARLYGDDFEAQVRAKIVSRELDVRAVLARLTQGEADAVIVYRSDLAIAGDAARAVEIPSEIQVVARYPIAVVRRTHERETARRFVAYLRGEQGQTILGRRGFTRCPD